MKIFNTMTRKKEELTPLVPGEYRIYVCGPTVYNYVHIGNARPVVVFDTLRRYLEYQGNRVLFVSNITDIDDKIIAKANEDVPVKVLGAVVQQPISIVCALAEKNIKTPEDLIGKKVIIAANLQPVKLCGEESSGMILATDLPDGNVQVIFVDDSVPNGSKLR